MSDSKVTSPEAHWRAALREGRLLLQRDASDGTAYFPPRLAGPKGQALEWIEASGRGTVYSVSAIHPRPPQQPYNVALVDLAEGARMMSRINGADPEDIAIGAPVAAQIAETEEGPQVVFHLA